MITRAKAEIEEVKEGEFRIIVTEIPYQVNKSTLLEEIANGVKEKRLDGIRDLRDESDKDGIRIVVELKRDSYPKKVLNQLLFIRNSKIVSLEHVGVDRWYTAQSFNT